MDNKQRIQALKDKIARADEAAKARDQERRDKEAAAASLKAELAEKWKPLKEHLQRFIEDLNSGLPSHAQLKMDGESAQGGGGIDVIVLSFRADRNRETLRTCRIHVNGTGKIQVRMGTSSTSPAKSYEASLDTLTEVELEGAVLDFLEINT